MQWGSMQLTIVQPYVGAKGTCAKGTALHRCPGDCCSPAEEITVTMPKSSNRQRKQGQMHGDAEQNWGSHARVQREQMGSCWMQRGLR